MIKPFEVQLEEYLTLALNFFMRDIYPQSRVAFEAGDYVEGFIPQDHSFSLRLLVNKIPYELNFQAEPEVLGHLLQEEHLYLYFYFYYPTDNIQGGVIRRPEKVPVSAITYTFDLEVDDKSKPIIVTLIAKKERAHDR